MNKKSRRISAPAPCIVHGFVGHLLGGGLETWGYCFH